MSRTAPPISRPVAAANLPAEGVRHRLTTSAAERAALAALLGVEAVHEASGEFLVQTRRAGARVTGRVRARVPRTCVVTLEPFDEVIDESVDVEFAGPDHPALRDLARGGEHGFGPDDPDPPDELVDGTVDLGALAGEFIALGMAPYPRKPGVDFEEPAPAVPEEGPFAALKALTARREGGE